ncbi:MAG TPA: ABC transporter permease [Lachnospiraceae bacterium]|nr:ABC transporter permease [Lachnospiraceae bacterium]
MRFSDMLSMSVSSLFKRKMRTIMTVMGVVIGTASIVVMVSLGLGLKKFTLENVQQWGSLTQVSVYAGGSDGYGGQTGTVTDTSTLLSDQTIESVARLEHVVSVEPELEVSVILRQGIYEANTNITGTTEKNLEHMKIPLESGTLPGDSGTVQLLYGNMVPVQFVNSKTNQGYWDTNALPDVDLSEPLFVIYDTSTYMNSKSGGSQTGSEFSGSSGGDGTTVSQQKVAKKYLTESAGIIAGGVDTYASYSWSVYTGIDSLKSQLKTVFRKSPIPGQPTMKNGKAYPDIYYSRLVVNVDDMENVEAVSESIKGLGYVTSSDSEWIQSELEQSDSIQTMLGGIGAVSLLVAAIGIANTMMMSIYERTKEIGVYKVLGCAMSNIRSMFLIEAAFIGLMGGIAGTGLSYLVSFIINKASEEGGGIVQGVSSSGISYIPPWLSLSSIVFATGVGVLSGLMPALRAMRLSPLAAIRNE